jgi:hypothetical protein
LEDAYELRLKRAATDPDLPDYRLNLIRTSCRLGEAEAGAHNLAKAKIYADGARAYLDTLSVQSASLFVLRAIGQCAESLGRMQRVMAADPSATPAERRRAEAESRESFQKSADVWTEWSRRGATPESDRARRRMVQLLRSPS